MGIAGRCLWCFVRLRKFNPSKNMNDAGKRILEIRQQLDALNVELAQLTGQVREDVDAKCRAFLAAGDKVGAVKTYRIAMGNTSCSLKEAVDYINTLPALPNGADQPRPREQAL